MGQHTDTTILYMMRSTGQDPVVFFSSAEAQQLKPKPQMITWRRENRSLCGSTVSSHPPEENNIIAHLFLLTNKSETNQADINTL